MTVEPALETPCPGSPAQRQTRSASPAFAHPPARPGSRTSKPPNPGCPDLAQPACLGQKPASPRPTADTVSRKKHTHRRWLITVRLLVLGARARKEDETGEPAGSGDGASLAIVVRPRPRKRGELRLSGFSPW
ncbi:hypothetical protein C8Q78DRAFT_702437 [Trametes maxima]|nr:hypothetical protein C8Q78DRAFT_702437 [Trametes maxima]